MRYGTMGQEMDLDVGQVFTLQGCVNDDKLIRLELVQRVTKRATVARCGGCQQEFIDDSLRDEHARKRHRRHFDADALTVAPVEIAGQLASGVDTTGDAEAAQLDARFPLRYDKTLATLRG